MTPAAPPPKSTSMATMTYTPETVLHASIFHCCSLTSSGSHPLINIFFYFMCQVFACLYVHLMCAWHCWRPEEGIGASRTRVSGVCTSLCSPRFPARLSVLHCWGLPLQAQDILFFFSENRSNVALPGLELTRLPPSPECWIKGTTMPHLLSHVMFT